MLKKILISLLFLAVAAVAAVFTIKIFSHDKSAQDPARLEEGRKPANLKDDQRFYSPSSPATRYGVVGIGRSR